MDPALSQKLVEVTADTLERLAFIFTFPAEEPPAMDGQTLKTVRVDFNGPFRGAVELSLPTAALSELAVNMLGAEDGEQPPQEQQHDALKELANVICGNLLPVLAGHSEEFSLCPPYLVTGASPRWEDAAAGFLMLESGPCRVRVQMDRPPGLGGAGRAEGCAAGPRDEP
jgi:CheY-specific phosphatase CheX